MQKTHPFVAYIIENSKPFGEAMVKAVNAIPDDKTMQGLLDIRKKHGDENKNRDRYEVQVKQYLKNQNLNLDTPTYDALLGYMNLKVMDPTFEPTIEAFSQRVFRAASRYSAFTEKAKKIPVATGEVVSAPYVVTVDKDNPDINVKYIPIGAHELDVEKGLLLSAIAAGRHTSEGKASDIYYHALQQPAAQQQQQAQARGRG